MINWIIHEPAESYHERSKSGEYLSSHMLKDFRKSPILYRKKTLGLVEEKQSEALAIGTATHKLILEGREAFDAEYTVSDGPINPKTGESYKKNSQAWAMWALTQSKEVISTEDFGKIATLWQSVQDHKKAKEILAEGEAEGVVRADYCGVPCQIRIDWYNPAFGIVDLKTTAELEFFNYDAKRLGYFHQLAFYRSVVNAAAGFKPPVFVIAVEKAEPYSCGVWQVADVSLDEAEAMNEAAIERLKSCRASGFWATGYEEIRVLSM